VHILYFADTRFPIERANGLQTMATCCALAGRGHRVTLVVRPDSCVPPRDPFAFYDFPRTDALTISVVDTSTGERTRRAQFVMASAARLLRADADVVYTRDLGLAALLLRLPRSRRPRLIYESHGIASIVSAEMAALLGKPEARPTHRKLERLDRRERRVWRRAAAYVTITRTLAVELAARYGERPNVFVVPDGAAVGSEVPSLRGSTFAEPGTPEPWNPGIPIAGYAGHLYPWKGVDVFLRALALAPGIRGLIVGGHPAEQDLARVRALVHELGLDARVDITGLVKPGDVRRRLAPASMLVLPNTPSAISERYTSPLKLFEYLSMRRPVIASDLPAIREVLTHERTALLVAPGDPRALAAALQRIAGDRALGCRLADAAAALAPQYSWEARAERLEAALAAAVAA